MILISHRANFNGPDKNKENSPRQIDEVLSVGLNCEIDVWVVDGQNLFLGHDRPIYGVDLGFLFERRDKLYIHAKNEDALQFFSKHHSFHFFSHHDDRFVVTSQGQIWCYPSKSPIKFGINLMPEWNGLTKEDLKDVFGICSDYIGIFQ